MRVQGPDGKVIEFPDGTPPEQMQAVMAKHYGGPKAAPQAQGFQEEWDDPPFLNPRGIELWRKLGKPDVGRMAAGTLPSVGGFAGGVGGGLAGAAATPYLGFSGAIPGAIAGAGAGGALGEVGKRAVLNQPMDPRAIMTRGAIEGGAQAAGGLLAGGVGLAGRLAARRAVSLAEKPAKSRFLGPLAGGLLGQSHGNAIPGAIAGVAAEAVINSPAVNAKLGKLLASPKFQRAARQSPRAAAAMVQQILLSAEPDALRQ